MVADTGDISAIERYRPRDATTNPSLLLEAARLPSYEGKVQAAAKTAASAPTAAARTEAFMDELAVAVGAEILALVSGRVSTEVWARLSFDEEATVQKARRLIELYGSRGIDRERVLIKVAATWEGIRAAERLEREGIHTNLTLLFSFAQAVACAQAGVTLISPFVGRIYDWHKKQRGGEDIPAEDDPGVASVTRIYRYFKRHGHHTEVMGASFRKKEQVLALAGCDLLTISPGLLAELAATEGEVPRRLDPESAAALGEERMPLDEPTYRWHHNQDPMAVEKLAEGIRRFDDDARKLERWAAEHVLA